MKAAKVIYGLALCACVNASFFLPSNFAYAANKYSCCSKSKDKGACCIANVENTCKDALIVGDCCKAQCESCLKTAFAPSSTPTPAKIKACMDKCVADIPQGGIGFYSLKITPRMAEALCPIDAY